jgi:hypothetical protein
LRYPAALWVDAEARHGFRNLFRRESNRDGDSRQSVELAAIAPLATEQVFEFNNLRMFTESHIEPLASAWRKAAEKVAFVFDSPHILTIDNERHSVIGFLPHFGSPNGMTLDTWIPGHPESTRSLHEAARRAGLFCSCISAETYDRYDEKIFIEALNDWGYFGPEKLRPPWARHRDAGSAPSGY